MLYGLFKYGSVAAKSKAIKSKQMKQADFEQLMQKVSLSEAVLFLKNNTHYTDIFKDTGERNLHRGDIENPLKKYYSSVLKKYYYFITNEDRKFFKILFLKEEIEALKDILRRIEGDKERFIAPIDDFVMGHFSVDIKKLSEAKSLNEFIEILSGTDYERILRHLINADLTKNMFSLEMALDSYYFKFIMSELKMGKKNKEIIKTIYGSEIDLKNIIWIYRCKKYYDVPKEIIYTYHIPYRYKLSKAVLQEMINAQKPADLYKIIRTTEYKELAEGLDSDSRIVFIENNYNKYFSNMLMKMKRENPMSLVSVIEELYSVDSEIRRIISIVECIRYSLNASEIKDMVG